MLWVAQGSRNKHKRIWARVSTPLVRRVRQQEVQRLFVGDALEVLLVGDALEVLLVLCEITQFHVHQGRQCLSFLTRSWA